jgi:hypothetical protein
LDRFQQKTEIVGIVAVVLSLLFVGYEVRRNTNISAAQAVFDLNEAGRQNLLLQVNDPEVAALVFAARNDPERMTEQQRYRYGRWVFSFLNLYESAWNHNQRGVISDADLEGWRIDYCQQMEFSQFATWAATITAHSSEFREDASRWCD